MTLPILGFKTKVLRYDSGLKERWLDGILQREWHEDYPQLFDDDDLDFALKQRNQHFGEWFTAIHYFKKGWRVFIEHYVYSRRKSNPFYEVRKGKNEKVKQLLGEENFNLLRYLGGKERQIRPPDLFIFNDKREFFFAEVKWGGDKPKGYQKNLFKQISNKLGVRIDLVRVIPK